MSNRDTIGAVILVALLVLIGAALFFTLPRPEGEPRSPAESVIVEQRMQNLKKNQGPAQ